MMSDPVYEGFLETAHEDHLTINRDSDVARLVPQPRAAGYPDRYQLMLVDIEHLVRAADGTVTTSADPVLCSVRFPADYLRSASENLLYRVVRVETPVFHPNIAGGTLCLGASFRPGTRLRAIVVQLYATLSERSFATQSPLDVEASRYYLAHLEQVSALRARPLWRRRLARHVRVQRSAGTAGPNETTPAGAAAAGGTEGRQGAK